jgi:hypothetical protein
MQFSNEYSSAGRIASTLLSTVQSSAVGTRWLQMQMLCRQGVFRAIQLQMQHAALSVPDSLTVNLINGALGRHAHSIDLQVEQLRDAVGLNSCEFTRYRDVQPAEEELPFASGAMGVHAVRGRLSDWAPQRAHRLQL